VAVGNREGNPSQSIADERRFGVDRATFRDTLDPPGTTWRARPCGALEELDIAPAMVMLPAT
jgi:hypothetical protein